MMPQEVSSEHSSPQLNNGTLPFAYSPDIERQFKQKSKRFRQYNMALEQFYYLAPIILLFDIIAFYSCFIFGHWVRMGSFPEITYFFRQDFFIVFTLQHIPFYIADAYNIEGNISGLRSPARILLSTLVCTAILGVIYFSIPLDFHTKNMGRGVLLYTLSFHAVMASFFRIYAVRWQRARISRAHWLAVGQTEDFHDFFQELQNEQVHQKVSFLLKQPANNLTESCEAYKIIGPWSNFEKVLEEGPWSGLIIGESIRQNPEILQQILLARLQGLRVYDVMDYYENIWFKVPVRTLKDRWLALSRGFLLLHNPIDLKIKRLIDLISSVILLVLLAPLIALTSLILWLVDGGPVIYQQNRVGLNNITFKLYKFRTMKRDAEADGVQWSCQNDQRVHWLGKFLRKMRIDEIPQLVNVVKGDMGLIGPRPERPEFMELIEKNIPYYHLRHLVRPGITGWAQVLYPYGSTLEDTKEKLQYDLYYLKNYGVMLDIAIMIKTVRVILLGKGR